MHTHIIAVYGICYKVLTMKTVYSRSKDWIRFWHRLRNGSQIVWKHEKARWGTRWFWFLWLNHLRQDCCDSSLILSMHSKDLSITSFCSHIFFTFHEFWWLFSAFSPLTYVVIGWTLKIKQLTLMVCRLLDTVVGGLEYVDGSSLWLDQSCIQTNFCIFWLYLSLLLTYHRE